MLFRSHGDLTEIAEGRFLTVSPTDSSRYEFRFEALPFALGLLIAAEIQMIHETKGNIHDEDLERIVGPIRGFDLLSQIIAAAAGLTCLNPKFSPTGSMVLIRMFFGLQNLDQGAFDSLAAYVPTSPDIFLDVAESPNGDAIRADEFILVLRRASHHGTVQDALKLRLPHWLGRWSRGTGVKFRDPAQDLQRKVDRDGRITQIIAGLSVDERHIFQNLTTEADSVMALNLDYVAALTIAGSALHPYAKGFIGWALAQRIAGDVHNASDDLAWVIRLNKVDWAATSKAMASEANSLSQHSAESFKRAAAIAWRLTGDAGQAKLAAQLFPHQIQIGWKRSDLFCDTNAFDPDAARCTNIVNAVSKIGALDSGEAWNFMSPTAEDHDLEMATAPLARFEPMVIVNKLREIFHTAPQRVGLKLRQLAWRLPGFSPLFDAQTLEAIQASYLAVVADPSRVEVADAKWITGFLAMSLLPHLAPEPQLDLILSLPPECLLLVAMESLIKPLSKTQLEVALQAAVISKDETRLTRTLFFPSSVRHIFTERTAELISDLVWHENETVAICALNAASLAGDVALFSRLLFDAKPDNGKVNSYLSLTRGKALAAATIATGDMSKLHCIPSRFIGFVAVQTKGIALTQFSNQFDQLFKHLLTPTTVQPPVTFEIKVEASEDGSRTRRRIDEVGGRSLNRIQDLLNTNFKVETERHEALLTDLAEYERRLTVEGAVDLADDPIRVGQCEILKLDKTRFEGWIDKILSTQDKLALRQIRNLALTLAHTFSTENSEKSAAILCLMKNVQPIVQIEVGHRRLPLYDRCLFSTATGLGLDQLRRELFECATEDAAIADATAAAEASGATMWLDAYVSELLTFPDPWKCALGMTIDGFRAKSIELPEIELVEGGFLTAVATSAGINRTNAKWASHWLELAIESTSGTDFWRYGQLALGVADGRAVDMFANTDDGQWTHYSNEFLSELKKTSKKVTEERRKTLYGVKAPSQALALFLRDN